MLVAPMGRGEEGMALDIVEQDEGAAARNGPSAPNQPHAGHGHR